MIHPSIMLLLLGVLANFPVFYLTWKFRDRFGEMMEMTPLAKKALILHVGYFVGCALYFQTNPSIPASPDSLSWQWTDGVFVTLIAYMLMALQNVVPRWTWLIPLSQLNSNLSSSFILIFFSSVGKETGKPIELIQKLNTVLIAGLLITYGYTFFTASVVGGYKQQQQ